MKKLLLMIFIAVFGLKSYAQIKYDPGYFIDNKGTKISCLIYNKDWRDNPESFRYKLDENSEARSAGLEDVQEFGVGDDLRYRKFLVPIDVSSDKIGDLSLTREPEFEMKWAFLKQLVEGETDFYLYKKGTMERYFYHENGEDVEPLIYKKYMREGHLATNNRYKQQLLIDLECESITVDDVKDLDYSKKDLVEFFENYNICQGSESVVFKENQKKKSFNFYLKGGVDLATMKIEKGFMAAGYETEFGLRPRFGAEIEYILPFNRNKWGVYAESNYRTHEMHESFQTNSVNNYSTVLNVEMNFLSTGIGFRHYFFLNESFKWFVNGAALFDIPFKSDILFETDERYSFDPHLDDTYTRLYLSVGGGFTYADRVSIEFRYDFQKTTVGSKMVMKSYNLNWVAQTTAASVVLGYKLF